MNLGIIDRIKMRLSNRLKSGGRNRVIKEFAEKNGLVHFGFVNQHSDEHKVVRGLTVSTTHQDNSYSVGTVDGYNVVIVDRSDLEQHKGKLVHFSWLIITIDLHTGYRIPHFFIAASGRDMDSYHPLFTSFPNMVEADNETMEVYGPDFNNRFKLYARPAKLSELEKVLTVDTVRVLAAHLWPFSVEQHDNVLYIYSDCSDVSVNMLTTMLKNGLFLAHNLDSKSDL